MKGFIGFIRRQGVVGLAVGFILGGAIAKVTTAVVNDLVNPLVGLLLGSAKGLESVKLNVGSTQLLIGHFVSVVLDFVVIALVVYCGVHILKLDRIDKKEEAMPVELVKDSSHVKTNKS